MNTADVEVKAIVEWQREIGAVNREKGWRDGPRSIPELIALMHSELSEMLEEYRDGQEPSDVRYTHNGRTMPYDDPRPGDLTHMNGATVFKPEGLGVELADLVIRALDFADEHDLDLEELIARKVAYNRTRPYRHGRFL